MHLWIMLACSSRMMSGSLGLGCYGPHLSEYLQKHLHMDCIKAGRISSVYLLLLRDLSGRISSGWFAASEMFCSQASAHVVAVCVTHERSQHIVVNVLEHVSDNKHGGGCG